MLIMEMERAIYKRDIIQAKFENRGKAQKGGKQNVTRQIQSMKNNVKQCTEKNSELIQRIGQTTEDLADVQN